MNTKLDDMLPLVGSRFGLNGPANDHNALKLVKERCLQVRSMGQNQLLILALPFRTNFLR